jgi:hypothetical protein
LRRSFACRVDCRRRPVDALEPLGKSQADEFRIVDEGALHQGKRMDELEHCPLVTAPDLEMRPDDARKVQAEEIDDLRIGLGAERGELGERGHGAFAFIASSSS